MKCKVKIVFSIVSIGIFIAGSIFFINGREDSKDELVNQVEYSTNYKGEQVIIEKKQSYAENQGSEKSIEIASNSNKNVNTNGYFNNYLEIVDEKVTITPYNVYYDNGKLIVKAYIYNGFTYEIFNINNIKIKLENEVGEIAEATFGELENIELDPRTFIEWTFTFDESSISNNNASLSTLYWNNSCNYSHQGYYLVSR